MKNFSIQFLIILNYLLRFYLCEVIDLHEHCTIKNVPMSCEITCKYLDLNNYENIDETKFIYSINCDHGYYLDIYFKNSKIHAFPNSFLKLILNNSSKKRFIVFLGFNQTNMTSLQIMNNNFIWQLDISNNLITKIEKNKLNGDQLEILNLNHNLIEEIDEYSFANLTKLSDLKLNNNKLKKLKKFTFSVNNFNFSNYEDLTIDLSYNQIDEIENQSFSNRKIDRIDLQNNQLKIIKYGMFQNIQNLQNLDLSYNLIEEIEKNSFENMTTLTEINLSYNKLKILHDQIFEGIRFVRIVLLSNNEFEKFNISVLFPLRYLETLEINDNKLNEIDYKNSKFKVSNINIRNNHWNCTYLEEMLTYFKQKNIELIEENEDFIIGTNIQRINCYNQSRNDLEFKVYSMDNASDDNKNLIFNFNGMKNKSSTINLTKLPPSGSIVFNFISNSNNHINFYFNINNRTQNKG